jgi:hypothetical protein
MKILREKLTLIFEHFFKFSSRNVLNVSALVRVNVEVDIRLDDKNVIHLVLTPDSVTWGLVVDSGEELELVNGNLQMKRSSVSIDKRHQWELNQLTSSA